MNKVSEWQMPLFDSHLQVGGKLRILSCVIRPAADTRIRYSKALVNHRNLSTMGGGETMTNV